jgi:hypothetical protein
MLRILEEQGMHTWKVLLSPQHMASELQRIGIAATPEATEPFVTGVRRLLDREIEIVHSPEVTARLKKIIDAHHAATKGKRKVKKRNPTVNPKQLIHQLTSLADPQVPTGD